LVDEYGILDMISLILIWPLIFRVSGVHSGLTKTKMAKKEEEIKQK
jgi:hypothetical protein